MDEDKTLSAIYYQDEVMKRKFEFYPEVMLVDGTYKLNKYRMPLYLQMVIDGNGESEIVAIFVVVNEDAATMCSLLDIFKKNNPAWTQTKTLLSDKDFVERKAYKEKFPNIELQICLFHVLKTFRREINCEKMNINKEQRNFSLETLQKLAYAPSEETYSQYVEILVSSGIRPVIDYYNTNWHEIKSEWVVGLKTSCHYDNHTNNRLESINQKIKQVISKFSDLKTFFHDLEVVIRCLRQEREGRVADVTMKTSINTYGKDSVEAKYQVYLTPYAFKIVEKQIHLARKVTIPDVSERELDQVTLQTSCGLVQTSSTSCNCLFSKTNELPCRHTFALRSKIGNDLFYMDATAKRWTKEYFCCSVKAHVEYADNTQDKIVNVPVTIREKPLVLTSFQKYRCAFQEAQKLATLSSEVSIDRITNKQSVTLFCVFVCGFCVYC